MAVFRLVRAGRVRGSRLKTRRELLSDLGLMGAKWVSPLNGKVVFKVK